MSECLKHDPTTKQQIKTVLYEALYAPVQRQFKQRIDTIIVKNTVITGFGHKSFMHKNVLYSCDTAPLPRKLNRLDPSLAAEMADYLKDLKQLNEKEVPYVIGYINQVLNSSNDLHDYLRLLPDAVHYPIRDLIATCPCHTKKLSDETVQLLQDKNLPLIQMMKERMVTNLLI